MSAMYSNCGFRAFPLIAAVLGEIGVFYGSACVGMFNLLFRGSLHAACLVMGSAGGSVGTVVMLCASCPSAASSVLMTAPLGMDSVYGSRIIFMTSILSVFTIPMLALVTSVILL